MSDVPVYVVANFTVHDADTYRQYEKGFSLFSSVMRGLFLPTMTIR